jgi:DNA-binding MarR family transcriptional regulator
MIVDTSGNIMWLLKQAFHHGRRTVNDAIRSHGVTTAQIGLLNRLSVSPGLSGAELARRALITPQAAQLALAGLERRGLVERRRDPDHGRILRTYVTAKGRRLTAACLSDAIASERRLLRVLGAAERETLRRLLHRLVDHAAPLLEDEQADGSFRAPRTGSRAAPASAAATRGGRPRRRRAGRSARRGR